MSADKGVRVKMIYRNNKVEKTELDRLKTIKNIELKSTNDLHAKCYFNEKEMIITSLNLLDTSEKNWEMGIYIDKNEDKDIFDAAIRDCLTIFSDSISPPNISIQNIEKSFFKTTMRAFCIRCECNIPFDVTKPYCRNCFSEWSLWSNEDYTETYCHLCGDYETTVRLKPLCYDCLKQI